MKILMYTSYYNPHISGLTLYFERLANEYTKLGHDVTMLTSKHDKDLSKYEVINSVKVIRSFVLFKINKGLIMPWLVFDAFKLIKNADIIHLNLPSIEAIWVVLVAKLFNKKIISTYVCDITLPKMCCRHGLEVMIDFVHHIILKSSNKILSFTKDFASYSRVLKNYKNIDGMLPIVELSSSLTVVKQLDKLVKENKKIIGMATRIASEKGVDDVINLLPELQKKEKNIHLVIAGNPVPIGESKYVLKIQKLLEQCSDKVTSFGNLNESEMNYFYKNIDVLVIASTNSTEAFGMVQAEAMLHGTPAVVTDLPGVRMPVKWTGMGEVAKMRDLKDLKNKILLVLQDEKYKIAVQDVKKLFNKDIIVSKMLDMYKASSSPI